jgi:hypothetical protein
MKSSRKTLHEFSSHIPQKSPKRKTSRSTICYKESNGPTSKIDRQAKTRTCAVEGGVLCLAVICECTRNLPLVGCRTRALRHTRPHAQPTRRKRMHVSTLPSCR